MVAAEKFAIAQSPCPVTVRTLAIRNGARVRILDEVCDLTQSYVDWLCFGYVHRFTCVLLRLFTHSKNMDANLYAQSAGVEIDRYPSQH